MADVAQQAQIDLQLIRLNRNGADGTCWVLRDGVVNCSKESVARLGWPNKALIRPAYIDSPLLLLFDIAEGDEHGVQLRYSSPTSAKGSTASIKSKPLAKIIRLHTTLPLNGLTPIYLTNGLADLALWVEPPSWVPFQFDKSGIQELPKKIGVYEFLDNKETVRVGEGNLPERMREHMANTTIASEVRSARYFLVKDKEESLAFEHLLLCLYHERAGRLPRYNAIKA